MNGHSRRERQLLDALYRLERATAADLREAIPDPPSYSAVRATLRILEEKGAIFHQEEEGRYVYRPAVPAHRARRSALRHLVDTFFEGSSAGAALALLGTPNARFSNEELDSLSELIEKARKESR